LCTLQARAEKGTSRLLLVKSFDRSIVYKLAVNIIPVRTDR